jgi:hypothetical protein
LPGTFEIQRKDGRRVVARLFKSDKEILDFILSQVPGDYLIYEVISTDEQREWGMVTHRQDGTVTRQPFPSEDE